MITFGINIKQGDIMSREENVIKYYVLCNKLKNVIRTGWKVWNVERERLESVAEHIFGVQMLAIAMKSEYEYDIDASNGLNITTIPAIISPWPPKYFVALWITTSTPKSIGLVI